MKCIDSPALEDWQLVSYMDGEADDSVAAHMADCTYCREKADRWSRLQNRLRARSYRINCHSPMELGEYHLGLLTPAQARDVKKHLSDCPLCQDEVAKLDDYLDKLAPQPGLLEPIRVLLARLVSGGGGGQGAGGFSLAPAFAGLRGEEEGHFVYQADNVQIDIEVQDDTEMPGLRVLLGLVTGLESNGFTIQVSREGNVVATNSIDNIGNFVITHLDPGLYQVTLTGSDVEIHIPRLQV